MPNVQSASNINGQVVVSTALAGVAMLLMLGSLPWELALVTLFMSVVGGVMIAYMLTLIQFRSIEDCGEFKFPISPRLVLVALLVFFVLLFYFEGRWVGSYAASSYLVVPSIIVYTLMPSESFAATVFYKRWEKEKGRQLFTETSMSVSRLYASPKPSPWSLPLNCAK